MKFYDREEEIAFLRETRAAAARAARFTVVTGRSDKYLAEEVWNEYQE